MSSFNTLKDRLATSTWKLVLLTIATAGLYPILWLAQTTQLLREETKAQIVASWYPVWLIGVAGWVSALYSTHDSDLSGFAGGLSLGMAILYIVWAFKAKKALEEHAINQYRVDPKMNSLLTFFLNVFYINYCINDLPNEERKQKLLSNQSP